MTAAEWAVAAGGAFLIAFELWFFLGGRRALTTGSPRQSWKLYL